MTAPINPQDLISQAIDIPAQSLAGGKAPHMDGGYNIMGG